MSATPPSSPQETSVTGAVEVFALLAAGELAAFARLADDAAHAPELRLRIVLSRMAAADLSPLDRVEQHVADLGVDPEELDDLIWEFREVLAEFDARTTPRDWWERLVRTYVGYGVFTDLERAVTAGLEGESAAVAAEVLGDAGLSDFVAATLRPVIDAEAQLGARLALWGRRTVGEAIGIAARLLQTHPELARSAATGLGLADASSSEQTTAVLNRLTSEHARRMNRLGLTA